MGGVRAMTVLMVEQVIPWVCTSCAWSGEDDRLESDVLLGGEGSGEVSRSDVSPTERGDAGEGLPGPNLLLANSFVCADARSLSLSCFRSRSLSCSVETATMQLLSLCACSLAKKLPPPPPPPPFPPVLLSVRLRTLRLLQLSSFAIELLGESEGMGTVVGSATAVNFAVLDAAAIADGAVVKGSEQQRANALSEAMHARVRVMTC